MLVYQRVSLKLFQLFQVIPKIGSNIIVYPENASESIPVLSCPNRSLGTSKCIAKCLGTSAFHPIAKRNPSETQAKPKDEFLWSCSEAQKTHGFHFAYFCSVSSHHTATIAVWLGSSLIAVGLTAQWTSWGWPCVARRRHGPDAADPWGIQDTYPMKRRCFGPNKNEWNIKANPTEASGDGGWWMMAKSLPAAQGHRGSSRDPPWRTSLRQPSFGWSQWNPRENCAVPETIELPSKNTGDSLQLIQGLSPAHFTRQSNCDPWNSSWEPGRLALCLCANLWTLHVHGIMVPKD